jgi:hypothetical protein
MFVLAVQNATGRQKSLMLGGKTGRNFAKIWKIKEGNLRE